MPRKGKSLESFSDHELWQELFARLELQIERSKEALQELEGVHGTPAQPSREGARVPIQRKSKRPPHQLSRWKAEASVLKTFEKMRGQPPRSTTREAQLAGDRIGAFVEKFPTGMAADEVRKYFGMDVALFGRAVAEAVLAQRVRRDGDFLVPSARRQARRPARPVTPNSKEIPRAQPVMAQAAVTTRAIFPTDFIIQALSRSGPLTVKEVAIAIQKAGWKANSPDPETKVRVFLSRLFQEKKVERLDDGRYELAPGVH
ncbi:hypothetical protein LZC95_19550 [Pendulispora brunnea]|uniref:HTH HARE-type domain-containing protein n=1 Tax=Pendulispora brunnea TaxID=2905690 RepID=A0ABZ2KK23_9BACT